MPHHDEREAHLDDVSQSLSEQRTLNRPKTNRDRDRTARHATAMLSSRGSFASRQTIACYLCPMP